MERLRPSDPEQIGPWQIVNRLGSGGMGIVYMGNNGTRAAAIKIVREFLLEDPSSRARLSREVAILRKIKGKYVAEIVGADIDSNPAWIATNYVDGPSLKTLIENEGPLSEEKWRELALGLMSALSAVHEAGVIHRDVKPSNILMSANGPKLIDFGISFTSDSTSLTRTGMVAGSPAWFSPEQFEGTKVTFAVDNFAAGTVLYFAATGSNPWGSDDTSVANTMYAILNNDADLSLLTANQKEIVGHLHRKSPTERSTAKEILARLEARGSSYGDAPSRDARSRASFWKRKKLLASLITILGIGFFGLLIALQTSPNDSENSNRASTLPAKQIEWSIQIVGDPKVRKGFGSRFSTYICDQAVLTESLQIKETTIPVSKEQPTVRLFSGDERCGKNFDTIEIRGQIDQSKNKRKYILAGSTQSGFLIQYDIIISFKV